MNVDMEFTDEEIREELARLGYENVPADKLAEFKKDLMKLISNERSKNTSFNSSGTELRDEDDSDACQDFRENHGRPRSGGEQKVDNVGPSYRENWHYRGKDSTSKGTRAQSAREKTRVPPSYSLYELQSSARYDDDGEDLICGGGDSSYSESERSYPKRKVYRKHDRSSNAKGGEKFYDQDKVWKEEVERCQKMRDDEDAKDQHEGIFEIYERIKDLAMRDCECEKSKTSSKDDEPPYRGASLNKIPSVIMPSTRPHCKNIVRSKPVNRMMMYQQLWKKQPAIGDDQRIKLRKEMHAKLLRKEEVQHDPKVYIPNTYVVPTSKQRLALRWEVRHALEKCQVPNTVLYRN